MNISYLSYKKSIIFWTLIFLVSIGGVYSFFKISKLEDPELTVMQAMVVTVYPGASAEEVENEVTTILENEIRTIAGVAEIKSSSYANVSQINVLLKFTVPDDEIGQAWDVLRRKVQFAQSKLPTGAMNPMVMDDFGDVYGIFYALTGDGYSYDDLSKYSNYIKREMLMLDGIKRVELVGNQIKEVSIQLSQKKLSQLGIYPAQILLAINGQTNPNYAGAYFHKESNIRLVVDSRLKDINEIGNIIIHGYENDHMRLSDVATITWQEQDPPRFMMMYNGKPSIGIAMSMESDENVIDVGKVVDKRLTEIMHQIPVGVEINKIFFQPDKVDEAIDDFMINLIMSVLVVIIVLMFTMGWRQGLILGVGLIITILATFPILLALDGQLQRISLGAFIVAMGMLVDNAIVVMDGISVSLQQHNSLKHALFETPRKTAMALLGATLIAVVAFLPVYLSPDTAGLYVGDLFIVLSISLLISWILALTQVPVFAAKFLPLAKISKSKEEPFNGKIFRIFETCLQNMMQHKVTTIIISCAILIISLGGFYFVKQTFFPDFNYNQAFVEFTMPKDATAQMVVKEMKIISDSLTNIKGVKAVTASHGMTPIRYCLVRSFNQGGDNYAEFIIEFDNYKTMRKQRKEIEEYFYNNYPGCYSRFRLYNLSILATHTVEVEFTGPNLNVLRSLENEAELIMRKSKNINQRTICSDMSEPTKTLIAHYAAMNAQAIGTQRSDISNTLLAATDGIPIGNLWMDDVAHPIKLCLRNNDGSYIKDLNNLPIWNLIPNFKAIDNQAILDLAQEKISTRELKQQIISPVPMSQVVDSLEMCFEESVIHHTNGRRAIQAQCNPIDKSSPAEVRNEIKKEIEKISLPDGYKMKWVGEYDLSKNALENIIDLLPVAAIFIIIILMLLFNNVKNTAIVIICLPFAAIGIVPGLLIFGQPFSFVAIVGTIGMAGMLIKNSIVLIDEIGYQIKNGQNPYNAIIVATISRLRPVMMASLTTILGMIPLIPDPMYGALAVTVMCGLLVGTIITLILLPIIYALFYNIHDKQ